MKNLTCLKIGTTFINTKKSNLLSLKLILGFIFFINNQIKNKKGKSIIICFNKKINGYCRWFRIPEFSKPVLPNISSEKDGNADQLLTKESVEGLKNKFLKIFKIDN